MTSRLLFPSFFRNHDIGMQPAENHPESNVPEGQNLSDDAVGKHLAAGLLRFLWVHIYIITKRQAVVSV